MSVRRWPAMNPTEPSPPTRGVSPAVSSCQLHVLVPWCLSTTRYCSVFFGETATTARPKSVFVEIPWANEVTCCGLPPTSASPSECGPRLTWNPCGETADVDLRRRRPDEGRGVQRRTQLPRQECRCVVCLPAAESGELGDGERGGEKERSGDREEKASPAFGRGSTLGFRRAPMRPQVREARHVLHPRARLLHVAPMEESALAAGSMSDFGGFRAEIL